MPSKNRFGLDDDQCFFPVLPGSRQEKPEDSIQLPEFRPPVPSIQNGELLAEGEVLECQFRTQPQGGRNQREQSQNREHHGREVSDPSTRKVNCFKRPGFWRTTGIYSGGPAVGETAAIGSLFRLSIGPRVLSGCLGGRLGIMYNVFSWLSSSHSVSESGCLSLARRTRSCFFTASAS